MQSQLQVAPPQLPPSVRPSKVFDTYWGFAAERQEIFFRRMAGAAPPWTADPCGKQLLPPAQFGLRIFHYSLRLADRRPCRVPLLLPGAIVHFA